MSKSIKVSENRIINLDYVGYKPFYRGRGRPRNSDYMLEMDSDMRSRLLVMKTGIGLPKPPKRVYTKKKIKKTHTRPSRALQVLFVIYFLATAGWINARVVGVQEVDAQSVMPFTHVEIQTPIETVKELTIEEKIRAYGWNDDLMVAIAKWESSGYACEFRPLALNDHMNEDGSEDRGLFQINSNTFKDFQRRHGDKMQELGITNYDEMYDVDKNIAMADLVVGEQGYRAFSSYKSGVYKTCGEE